jgi:hypothetical protein
MEELNKENVKNALDDLFESALEYKKSPEYLKFINFLTTFKQYSLFNASLVYAQMRGARYVLPAKQWKEKYKRTLKPNAQPLVLLRPMGPVMFCFDVSQTEGGYLPREIENPFFISGELPSKAYTNLVSSSLKNGLEIIELSLGSTLAGFVENVDDPKHKKIAELVSGRKKYITYKNKEVELFARIAVNSNYTKVVNFPTIVHEIAHILCGHLGPWEGWPNRSNLDKTIEEFEAESVTYLVCKRIGINTFSEKYLSEYLDNHSLIPNVSIDLIVKSAQTIERWIKQK